MATRFVRIDLSDIARDFRPIAVEPGVAMLDPSGAHARILFRWLGGIIAEPVWEGEAVSFFVRDDHGGRLEDVICQPATGQEVKSLLKDDLAKLKSRIDKIHPETPTERMLRKILVHTFQDLMDNPARDDLDCYFYRYRDVTGCWRLVWCWGFQRVDQEPAPAVVCTDPACNLLFVRRPGRSPRCPSCEALLAYRPVRKTNLKLTALVGLLLFLLGAAIVWWAMRPNRLIADPPQFAGPIGGRSEIKVSQARMFGKKDVSREAVGSVLDPRVARFDQQTGAVTLVGAGATLLRFRMGDLTTDVELRAGLATNPDRISIEPSKIELGIGTTARPKVMGEYADGSRLDLTEAAVWKPQNDGKVFSSGGLVEGLAEGNTTISARYRANPESPWLDASASISVAKINYKSLEAGIVPEPVGLGRASQLRLDAISDDGKPYRVLESSQLKMSVDPPYVATAQGRSIRGNQVGKGKLAATFGPNKLTVEKEFSVVLLPGTEFVVSPDTLDLVVGEIADLNVTTPSSEPIAFVSSDPKIVEVTPQNRLVGRAVGEAEVGVNQAAETRVVKVNVVAAEFQGIAIEPASVAVPVDDTVRPRVMAQVQVADTPRTAEIAPDLVACDKKPSPRFAGFNPKTLELKGMTPTDPGAPQTLALRVGKYTTTAPVEVVAGPFDLEVTPTGPVDVPTGQMRRLKPFANYSGGRRVQLPGERIMLQIDKSTSPAPGLEIHGNGVAAVKPGGGPLSVYATYLGHESNHVVFKSIDLDPNLKIIAKADPPNPSLGKGGHVYVVAAGADDEIELAPGLAVYKTSDDKRAKIDEHNGTFLATGPGEATITVNHLAAKDAATVALTVSGQIGPPRDIPTSVVITSDNGQSVRFPLGAAFKSPNDFRVEAHYADGFTRLVSKRCTMRTPESADKAVVTFSNGLMIGVRPGRTDVSAEYEGVHTKEPLAVEVLGSIDLDKIVVEPAPSFEIMPGETVSLHAIGYKSDKSVGDITGMPGLAWQSSNTQVARVAGPAVSGASLGQADVTVKLGNITSQPTQVSVVDKISDRLKIEPKNIVLRVGESVRIGSDVQVMRGDIDMSQQCNVTSAVPSIVEFNPSDRALIGRAPGRSPVTFTLGGKLVNTDVEVVASAGPIAGEVIVEPSAATMAPGQCEPLRVFVVTAAGERVDRTASAVLRSSVPKSVSILGDRACALVPGTSEILAIVSGADRPGKAIITVNSEDLKGLDIRPTQFDMSVGDARSMAIFGQADCGTRELFSQPDLKVGLIEARPGVIKLVGNSEVNAMAIGQASIEATWRDRLKAQAQVTVANNPLTDLRIEPSTQTLRVGEALTYQVTGKKGGNIVVLGPENGVKLFTDKPEVAQPVPDSLVVSASSPGHTTVVAQIGTQKAEASLDVVGTDVVVDRVVDPNVHIIGQDEVIVDRHGHRHHRHRRGDVVEVVRDDGVVETVVAGNVTGLRFVPDHLATGVNAQPLPVRVFEVTDAGRDGRDVSGDPNLVITDPGDIATLEKTPDGPLFRPLKPGTRKVDAKLGSLTSVAPLLIDIGGDIAMSAAKLVVTPDPIVLWAGESKGPESVMLDPGGGQTPFPVPYKLTAPDGQGVVTVDGENKVRANAPGTAQVVVTAADPQFQGVSAPVTVQVTTADELSIDPAQISLQVGQKTPPLAVTSRSPDGTMVAVPALLESMDANVLAPAPDAAGQFVAKSQGQTKLRAVYRGKEATATVAVTGTRFVDVQPKLASATKDNFDVNIDVLADAAEGELEYRVYPEGQTPTENWVPSQVEGNTRKVAIRSPPLRMGQYGDMYHLIIEARDKATRSVQQYPMTFKLEAIVTRAN